MGIGKGSGRGGVRANAGRKSKDGASWAVAIYAYLDQDSADLVEEYGGGSVGIRLALTELRRLQSIAKENMSYHGITRRAAVGTSLPTPPKKRAVPEFSPDGVRYNIQTRMRLEREAEEAYDMAMVEYKKNTGAR